MRKGPFFLSPEENDPGGVKWTGHRCWPPFPQCTQRLRSGRLARPVSTPRAPPMCLVLGAGETEMNEPQRLALGLMGCVGGRGRQTEDYSIQG